MSHSYKKSFTFLKIDVAFSPRDEYPGSVVVPDCIGTWSLHPYLLLCHMVNSDVTFLHKDV